MTNNSTAPATPSQREALSQALLGILPPDLTESEAARLIKKISEVVAVAAPVALRIVRPPPKPEIKITVVAEFEIDGVPHDAVLVHQEGEEYVLGEDAIKRADEDRPDMKVVRSEEDWQRAHKHRAKLPSSLNSYWLATARPYPDVPRNVSCLGRGGREWYEGWGALGYRWSRRGLVLRRRM